MTPKELFKMIEALDATHPWSKSPEGHSYWNRLHTKLFNIYHGSREKEQTDDEFIHEQLEFLVISYKPKKESAGYVPISETVMRKDWITRAIIHLSILRSMDHEPSRFMSNLIAERYRYDFKRRNHVFDAAN